MKRPMKRPCAFEGCGFMAHARGLCMAHYQQRLAHPDRPLVAVNRRLSPSSTPKTCSLSGCTRPSRCLGMCNSHYASYKRAKGRGEVDLGHWRLPLRRRIGTTEVALEAVLPEQLLLPLEAYATARGLSNSAALVEAAGRFLAELKPRLPTGTNSRRAA